ncbi:hypothetical protein SLS64_000401 [Diaporthe eres]|uniref:Uncharacterized protein n=1 Tax=Diaporthe eres TaxID=83184 RepID=A0ABR1PET9_DIAER
MPPPPEENKQASAQVAVDLLWEISQILTTIKELRKGAQETKIELESRKQQQQQQ